MIKIQIDFPPNFVLIQNSFELSCCTSSYCDIHDQKYVYKKVNEYILNLHYHLNKNK